MVNKIISNLFFIQKIIYKFARVIKKLHKYIYK